MIGCERDANYLEEFAEWRAAVYDYLPDKN